jgi:hypothetical protein
MQPDRFPLNTRDEEFLEQMRQVWAIMVDVNVQRERIILISQLLQVNERRVRDIIQDAQLLFGDLLKVDAEFEKSLIKERLWKLHDVALEAGDYETAGKMLERITRLQGYDREDGGIKREDIALPQIIFSSNPKALTDNIEADYAESEEVHLLEPEADPIPAVQSAD